MEKIKNLIYPGKTQDDETLYGQGGNTGVLSGEGSHLAGAKGTEGSGNTSGVPGSYPIDNTGAGNSGLASGTTTGNTSGLAGTQDTTGTGAGSTSLGSGTTTAGTHSSQFANAVDPRVETNPSETRQAEGTNFTSSTIPPQGNVGSGTGAGSNTTGQHHIGRDAAALGTTGVAGEELHRRREHERDNLGSTGTGYNPSSTTQGISHLGRDTAGEGSHLHHQHGQDDLRSDANIASQYVEHSNLPSDSNTTNTSSGHHLGRDAAAVGGAGALAEHEHRKHEPTTTGYGDQSGLIGSGLTQDTRRNDGTEGNLGSNTGYGNTSGTSGASGPHSTATANRLDPRVNTSGTGGVEDAHHHSKTHGGGAEEADHHHNLGRDAAVGAGGVGAAGLAEHEHRKHENEQSTGTGFGSTGVGSTSGTGVGSSQPYDNAASSGPAPNTAGPHSKDWMNKLDPRVDANPADPNVTSGEVPGHGTTGKDHHYGRDAAVAGGVGGAAYEADKHHKHDKDLTAAEREAKREHKHELKEEKREAKEEKREAKQAQHGDHHYGRDAAGAGVIGGAAYEADKHHQGHRQTDSGVAGVGSGNTTTGPHSSNLANRADPTVDSGRLQEHHYGRDAAGAGAIGGAAYEADKHHRDHQTGSGLTGTTAGNTTTAGPHSSNLANRADPTVDSDRSKDHHYGRDAAGAGVVGGAAYEAEKHHKHDKDLSAQEKEDRKIAKLEAKEDKKEAKAEKKEHKGLFSFLHRDKSKKYTPEEEAEFDRQEREHESHKGRDALAGGAVGAGAYEAEKHHQHGTDTNKPLPTAPGNHGIGTGAGTQNALISGPGEVGFHRAGDGELNTASGAGAGSNTGAGPNTGYGNTSNTTGQHHLGRDAAIGAGGAGALAAGEHEHNKHGHEVPLSEKPVGTDLGDKLHGVERNRGVPGPTGYPGQEGYGSTTGNTGAGSTGQHHYGRDAAAVGGAGALAEHEHRKHEGVGSSGVGNQSSGITGDNAPGQKYGNQSGLTTGSNTSGQQHHLGRDAAAVGGAGALAEHEHHKHEGQDSHVSGTNQQSTLPTRNRSEGSGNPISSSAAGSQGAQGEQHHLGRDAAAGAGAAGLAEHEHRKHEDTTSDEHHPARDAAAGAGAAGVAEHEHRKHEEGHATGAVTSNEIKGTGPFHYHNKNDPNAPALEGDQYRKFHGMGTDGTIGEIPTNTGSGRGVVEGEDGRNRLHKDPPASHPAAQAQRGEIDGAGSGVGTQSAGGEHRPGNERLAAQGERNMADDGARGESNVSTNY